MAELLPDYWDMEEYGVPCCNHGHFSQCKGLIIKFQHGLEYYSFLVSIPATRNLDHMEHFMAYQRTIIKAHWSIMGEGWKSYVWFLLPHKFVEMRESWFQSMQWNICRQSKSSIRVHTLFKCATFFCNLSWHTWFDQFKKWKTTMQDISCKVILRHSMWPLQKLQRGITAHMLPSAIKLPHLCVVLGGINICSYDYCVKFNMVIMVLYNIL